MHPMPTRFARQLGRAHEADARRSATAHRLAVAAGTDTSARVVSALAALVGRLDADRAARREVASGAATTTPATTTDDFVAAA